MDIAIIPYVLLRMVCPRGKNLHELNILLSSIGIIILFISLRGELIELLNSLPHFCLVDKLVQIPCPFCGTTRSLSELSQWNLARAMELNPTGPLYGLYLLIQVPLRTITITRTDGLPSIEKFTKLFGYAIFFIAGANWIAHLVRY